MELHRIAGYCRISVDEELDRDNVSIENQKSIVRQFVAQRFPGSALDFYEDRDRSGYTFEQREGYQRLRAGLMRREYDILVVKDFSRFSRRNSRGLVELEDLRDAGVRIISIGDNIDFPNDDDWLKIQFQFLINEMPVTDTSRKVRSVIRRRQEEGRWICAAPYGYVVGAQQQFEVVPQEAEVVRRVYSLYLDGWGYKRIANRLTDEGVPTPRASEQERRLERGEKTSRRTGRAWSIVTVQGMLDNDFYTGTLRQGKYTRKKINGADRKCDEREQLVFEHHHPPIIDERTFAAVRAQRQKRAKTNYRGVKVHDNPYSGLLACGDCGSPLFAMGRSDLAPAYHCGAYHRRGRSACTSHHMRQDTLDALVRAYIRRVRENSAAMLDRLNADLRSERDRLSGPRAAESSAQALDQLRAELRTAKRQRIRDIARHPEREALLEATYDELEGELLQRIEALERQAAAQRDLKVALRSVRSVADAAMAVFNDLLHCEAFGRAELDMILDGIRVYEDHVEVQLKADVDGLLAGAPAAQAEQTVVQTARNRKERTFAVHVVSSGDPLEIFTDRDGEVILKKYSPIGELSGFAKEYAESLVRALGHAAAVCDKDQIVSAAGALRKELQDKPISPELEGVLKERRTVCATAREGRLLPILSGEDASAYTAQVVTPILVEGEPVGAVILLSREPGANMGQTEIKVTETAAGFIGRQMEQ